MKGNDFRDHTHHCFGLPINSFEKISCELINCDHELIRVDMWMLVKNS